MPAPTMATLPVGLGRLLDEDMTVVVVRACCCCDCGRAWITLPAAPPAPPPRGMMRGVMKAAVVLVLMLLLTVVAEKRTMNRSKESNSGDSMELKGLALVVSSLCYYGCEVLLCRENGAWCAYRTVLLGLAGGLVDEDGDRRFARANVVSPYPKRGALKGSHALPNP